MVLTIRPEHREGCGTRLLKEAGAPQRGRVSRILRPIAVATGIPDVVLRLFITYSVLEFEGCDTQVSVDLALDNWLATTLTGSDSGTAH